MSLNWKELESNIKEMRGSIEGSQLQKLAQLGELALHQGLLIRGYSPKKGAWRAVILLMEKHTGFFFLPSRVDFSQSKAPNTFTMVLRKHLMGERVNSFYQIEGERICWMEFSNNKVLVLELIPRRSNAILLENFDEEKLCGKCLGSFHRVSLSKGANYSLLKPKKFDLKDVRDFSEYEGKNFSEKIGHYFCSILNGESYLSKRKEIVSVLKKNLKKINSSITKSKINEKHVKESEQVRDQALALSENLYKFSNKVPVSEKLLDLEIPSKEKIVSVELAPSLTYAENADKLFKKAKKMDRTREKAESILEELNSKKEDIEKLVKATEKASSMEELAELEKILLNKAILKKISSRVSKKGAGQGTPEKNKLYLELISSDGFLILCGRNQKENREVTFRAAKGNDIWMHVKQISGSHVLIKSKKNKTVPLQTLLEAAQLALFYSKVRNSKKTEVDYTFRKNVKPIRGSVSKVTYSANKSLVVDSDPALVKKILQSSGVFK